MEGVPPALLPITERPERSALFVDFDGTLAAIVAVPDEARPLPGVPELLAGLARRLGLVAVVSGRPAAFLRRHLGGATGVRLLGLYGLEWVSDAGRIITHDEARRWRPMLAATAERARSGAPPGVFVEPKGLTVTLHWRDAPEGEAWARGFCDDERRRVGLVAHEARLSLELAPPLGVDKGTVVRSLSAGFSAVACFGDDLGDLAAFHALDDLGAAGAAVARVAVVDAESPPALAEAADVVVEGPAGAMALLGRLLG
jgi:trehalose 6-phosphate phosphatase